MTKQEFIAQTDAIANKWGNISGNDLRREMFKWYNGKKPADQFTEADVQELANTHARESIRSAFPNNYQKQTELMEKMGVAAPVSDIKVDRNKILEEFGVKGLGYLTDEQIAQIAARNKTSFNNMKQVLNNESEAYLKSNAENLHKIHETDVPVIREYQARRINGGDIDEMRELFAKRPDLLAEFDAIDDGTSIFAKAASAVNRYAGGGSSANAYADHVRNPDEYESDYDGMARPIAADGVTGAAQVVGGKVGGRIVSKAVERPIAKAFVANAGDSFVQGVGELGRQAVAGEDIDLAKAGVVASSQATAPYLLETGVSKLSSNIGKIPVITPAINKFRKGTIVNPEVVTRDAMYTEGKNIQKALNNATPNSDYLKVKMDDLGMGDSKQALIDAEGKYISAKDEKFALAEKISKVEKAHSDITKKANRARNPERKAALKEQQNDLAREIIELNQKAQNINTDVLWNEMEGAQARAYERLGNKATEMIDLSNKPASDIFHRGSNEPLNAQEQSLFNIIKDDVEPNPLKSPYDVMKEAVESGKVFKADGNIDYKALNNAGKKADRVLKVREVQDFFNNNTSDIIGAMSNNVSREGYNQGVLDFIGVTSDAYEQRKKLMEKAAKIGNDYAVKFLPQF